MFGTRAQAAGTAARLILALCWSAAITGAAWAQADGQLTPEERRQKLELLIQEAKDKAESEREAAQGDAAAEAEARRRAAARAAAERRKAADEATAALRAAQAEAAEKAAAERAALEASLAPFGLFRDCPECPEMVRIPAGSFSMGDLSTQAGAAALPGRVFQALRGALGGADSKNDEGPVRTVKVASFAVGKYEVTFAQWDACVAGGGCSNYKPADHGWGRDRLPVINVSWSQAQQYVLWLSNLTGKRYRLLSEAEWEFVARAGTKAKYSFGDSVNCNQAHYGHADGTCGTRQKTLPVGSFAANPWGLHDLHGNVWEWVEDCRNASYADAPADARARTSGDCERRMYRGGGWSSSPDWLRSAFRGSDTASARYYDLGLRLARSD